VITACLSVELYNNCTDEVLWGEFTYYKVKTTMHYGPHYLRKWLANSWEGKWKYDCSKL